MAAIWLWVKVEIKRPRPGRARSRCEWHCAVDPGADLDAVAARHLAHKVGRNFQRQAQFAAPPAAIELIVIGNRWLFDEIARACEIERVNLAGRGLIVIEHSKGQILNVHADAVAHDEHEEH